MIMLRNLLKSEASKCIGNWKTLLTEFSTVHDASFFLLEKSKNVCIQDINRHHIAQGTELPAQCGQILQAHQSWQAYIYWSLLTICLGTLLCTFKFEVGVNSHYIPWQVDSYFHVSVYWCISRYTNQRFDAENALCDSLVLNGCRR